MLIQVKAGAEVVDLLDWEAGAGSDLSLGALKDLIGDRTGIVREKLTVLCKGRKLNGVAFPDDLPLAEALGSALRTKPGAAPVACLLLQVLGPKDEAKVALATLEAEVAAASAGPDAFSQAQFGAGKPLDATTFGEWSVKLDSLENLGEADRARRRALLNAIALLETSGGSGQHGARSEGA